MSTRGTRVKAGGPHAGEARVRRLVERRRAAEDALRESERRLATLLGNLPGMAYRYRGDGGAWILELVSDGARELTGYPAEALIANPGRGLPCIHPDDRPHVEREVGAQLTESGRFEHSYRIVTAERVEKWVLDRGVRVVSVDGAPAIEGFMSDITARKQSEVELRESEEKFSKAFRATPNAVSISDRATGRYLDVNEGFERLFACRRDEVIGRTSHELGFWANPEDRVRLVERLERDGAVRDLEAVGQTRAGDLRTCLISGEVIDIGGRSALVLIVHDITEWREAETARAELEAQLRHAQKLEALGQLAGGIAHDFNNILAAMIAYTELADMDAADAGAVRAHLEQVRRAGDRARDLVQQILAFSRQQKQERRPMRLQPAIAEALRLLRSTLPTTIAIEAPVDTEAPAILADPTQINQVLMNLCTNAAHAMRDGPGVLTVALDLAVVDEDASGRRPDVPPGRHARLTVRDTGHGMDDATVKRIYEPFFTTKGPGQGTGLGLAVVHGIIRDHEGAIEVESAPGVGTTFVLHFPEHHDAAVLDVGEGSSRLPRGDGQRVLFVDDEASLCDSCERLLTRLGYVVTTRRDPLEALELFRERPSDFDLVLTDLTMPRMTGLDLARALLEIRPRMPIVLVSGFSGSWTPAAVRSLGLRDLVAKPLTAQTLASVVRRALEK